MSLSLNGFPQPEKAWCQTEYTVSPGIGFPPTSTRGMNFVTHRQPPHLQYIVIIIIISFPSLFIGCVHRVRASGVCRMGDSMLRTMLHFSLSKLQVKEVEVVVEKELLVSSQDLL